MKTAQRPVRLTDRWLVRKRTPSTFQPPFTKTINHTHPDTRQTIYARRQHKSIQQRAAVGTSYSVLETLPECAARQSRFWRILINYARWAPTKSAAPTFFQVKLATNVKRLPRSLIPFRQHENLGALHTRPINVAF